MNLKILYNFKITLICSFALFAMFFGSGNLVFPLKVGQIVGNHWIYGFIGLFLSGILLPFLGLFVVKKFNGNTTEFFNGAGKTAGFLIPFISLSLMGSFGVIPRCITVAHGGIEFLFPNIPLFVTSALFCTVMFLLCVNNEMIVQTIGKFLSPFKFLSIFTLIIIAIIYAPNLEVIPENKFFKSDAIETGIVGGYEMMDLIASFFFSALVFSYIKNLFKDSLNEKELIKFAVKPAILGSFLIAITYFSLLYLGAHYSLITKDIPSEKILPAIAMHALGHHSTIFISFVMTISCLTTAVALNTVFARYIHSIVHFISFKTCLFITTITSFLMSLLSFKGISAILGPILVCMYPALIFLTLASFFIKGETKFKKLTFYLIILITTIINFL